MSIAGSAIATLQKEFRSSSPRKIIKPVKSPSPSRRATVEGRGPPDAVPPPFKDVRFQSQVVLQQSAAVAVSEEEFEDWEPQVGPIVLLLPHPLTPFGFSPTPHLNEIITRCPLVSQKLLFNFLSPTRLHPSSLQDFHLLLFLHPNRSSRLACWFLSSILHSCLLMMFFLLSRRCLLSP